MRPVGEQHFLHHIYRNFYLVNSAPMWGGIMTGYSEVDLPSLVSLIPSSLPVFIAANTDDQFGA